MQKKTNNAPNYERFKVSTVLMVMYNILLIRATCNFDFIFSVCLYRNGQLFEYNNF